MGASYSATLHGAVRWVHLAPGAYLKGAVTFWGSDLHNDPHTGSSSGDGAGAGYKLTGFGVLSGEQYVWGADPNFGYNHTATGYGQLKMMQLQCNAGCSALTMHGVTVNEPPFYAMVIYGKTSPSLGLATQVAQYKLVGGWYWLTSGVELGSQGTGAWGRGSLRNSFLHCNDDCLVLWHANNTVTNVGIWGGTNGANIQLGWVPRELTNVDVDGVDVVHNLMGWSDDKGNNCVINASPLIPGFPANANLNLDNFSMKNIRSEGATLCGLRLAVEMTYKSFLLENFAVDAWNDLGVPAQRSSYYQADPAKFIAPFERALVLKNYTVGGVKITRKANNWQASGAGRLNFSADMWDYWTAE